MFEKDFIIVPINEKAHWYVCIICFPRLNKHRQMIQDLCFTDKYIPGKENPNDYASRHPHSIDHLTQEQREEAGVDDGTETHVMKILLSDLPDALSIDHIKEGVAMDPTYQKLVTAIRQ